MSKKMLVDPIWSAGNVDIPRATAQPCNACHKLKTRGSKNNTEGIWLCTACAKSRVRAANERLLGELPSFSSGLRKLGSKP